MGVEDCEAVGVVRVRGWQFAYPGLVPQPYLDAMDPARDAAARRAQFAEGGARTVHVVAEREGAVVGWACCGPHRADAAHTGGAELYAIYVLPGHLSSGVGRALLDEMIARATAAGHRTLRLWVLAGNTRARRFYEKAGFTFDGTEDTFRVAGSPVPEVRYARRLSDRDAAMPSAG